MRKFARKVVDLIRLIPFNPMTTLWDSDKKHRKEDR